MRKIETLFDLKTERTRLYIRKAQLENEIKNDFEALKASFAPAQVVADAAATMLVNKNHGLVNGATSTLLDLILKNILLKNAGFMTRLVLPFIAKNTANNFVANNKTKILGWVGDLILKAGSKKNKNHIYDSSTADVDV